MLDVLVPKENLRLSIKRNIAREITSGLLDTGLRTVQL